MKVYNFQASAGEFDDPIQTEASAGYNFCGCCGSNVSKSLEFFKNTDPNSIAVYVGNESVPGADEVVALEEGGFINFKYKLLGTPERDRRDDTYE